MAAQGRRTTSLAALSALLALAPAAAWCGEAVKANSPVISVALEQPFPSPRETFVEAVEIIKRDSYNSDLNDEIIYYAAINGILRHLSPPSDKDMLSLIPPDVEKAKSQHASGNLCSIGINVALLPVGERYNMVVGDIIPGSPASKSGLKLKDIIHTIDDTFLGGMTSTKAEAMLENRVKGAIVKVGVRRGDEMLEFKIPAAPYRAQFVRARMLGDFGLIRIMKFGDGVQRDFPDALERLRKQKAKGLVIDLRGNEGGVADTATLAACSLLKKGAVVGYESGKDHVKTPIKCARGGDTRTKVVVLTDVETVSAAEQMTAALKENGRAFVVGLKTKGYGATKRAERLKNGYGFRVITHVSFGPSGETWLGRGIAPDKEIEAREIDMVEARFEPDAAKAIARDPQVAGAIAALSAPR